MQVLHLKVVGYIRFHFIFVCLTEEVKSLIMVLLAIAVLYTKMFYLNFYETQSYLFPWYCIPHYEQAEIINPFSLNQDS